MLPTPGSWLGPFDEFGGKVEGRSVAAELQKLDNSGMPQPSRRPGFLKKALDSIGLLHPIRMENLESDVARQCGIIRLVDDAEATRSQLGFNVIMTDLWRRRQISPVGGRRGAGRR